MRTFRIFLLQLVLILTSVLFGLFTVEIILRISQSDGIWNKVKEANILRNFHREYEINGLYPTDKTAISYSRDEFGLRDACKKPADIDILTVGGSITDQRNLNLENTYQTTLGDNITKFLEKTVCVSNAGVNGHSTFGHIYSFNHWFPLIPDLKPEYVMLYIGSTDSNFERTKGALIGFDTHAVNSFKSFLKNLYIIQNLLPLYRLLRDGTNGRIVRFAHQTNPQFKESDYTVSVLNKNTPLLAAANAQAFRNRLEIILKQINAMGSRPMCVTQPHQYTMKINGEIKGIPMQFWMPGGFSGLDFDYSIRQLNSVMADLCGHQFLDLYSENFSAKHFYDGVHNTDIGSKHVGRLMFEQMKHKGLLSAF